MSPIDPNSSNDILTQLRLALQDPTKAQALRLALADPTKAQALRNALAASGGPATLSNTLAAAGTAASKAGANSPIGALVGALTGAGINLFKRRGQQAGKIQSTAGADRGIGSQQTTDPYEPNLSSRAGGGGGGAATAGLSGIADTGGAAIPGNLQMGQDRYGNNIHSNDGGQTWASDTSGAPVAGPAYNATSIGTVGGGSATALAPGEMGGGYSETDLGGAGQLDALMSPGDFGGEYARGGRVKAPPKKAILLRRPGGAKKLAIPVISTTIVIARKPDKKAEKKARGGVRPVAEPRKVPLKQGAASEPPAPFKKGGRVQVPRGSGIAQRGKRFRGIF